VLVNNLGGSPPLEISIVTRRALQWLESRHIIVERVYMGPFMTSLEMAGVSITLLKVGLDGGRVCHNIKGIFLLQLTCLVSHSFISRYRLGRITSFWKG